MKKGFLFTTAIAMALGVGVAVGAHQSQRVEKAEAEDVENITLYCKMQYDWWWATGGWDDDPIPAGIGVHYWHEYTATEFPGVRGTKLETDPTVWKFEVPSDAQGFVFTRISGEGAIDFWGAQTEDLTFVEGKNFYTITSSSETWWTSDYQCVEGIWGKLCNVTTHVRGETKVVSVAEGGLPENPSLAFGEKSFDGWFDNEECTVGHEVTAITEGVEHVYAKITALETHSYTLDVSLVDGTYTAPRIYAWFEDGRKNADWPGVAIESDTFTLPEGASFVIVSKEEEDGRKQTVDISQPINPVDNETLIVTDELSDGKNLAYWQLDEVDPENDGYYLVGSKNNYKFRDATFIGEQDKDVDLNVGILLDYVAEVDELVTVRGFFENVDSWVASADPVKDAEGQLPFGYRVDNNFKFTTAGHYDIFVHEDGFYVATHAERHNVAIINLLFEGSFRRDIVARPATLATEGALFNPGVYDVEGYHQEGYFTDEECLQKYTPTEITTDDVQLYCKYMKVGYYVISGEGFWSLDNAFLMDSPDNPSNKAEVSIRVYDVGETYSFVYYDGEKHGHAGLGDEYEFVVNEEDHIKFTKVGNYAVYWSNGDNKLYVNAGLEAFYTNFLNSVGGACHSDGIYAEGELQAVKDAWDLQEAAYNALTTEEQNTIKAIGFDPDSESQDQSVRMVKMYSYIVKKYGTAVFNDFIWNQNRAGEHTQILANFSNVESGAASTIVIVIAVATVSAIACGMLFIFKKKEQK